MTHLRQGDLQRVLDNFVAQASGVTHALVTSPDGSPAAASTSCGNLAEHWASLCTGQLGIARAMGEVATLGSVGQVMLRYSAGNFLLTPMEVGGGLAVLTQSDVPLPAVAEEVRSFWARLAT